jgi:hypothetical protein
MRMWTKSAGLFLLVAAGSLVSGCEPTPEFVEQWANTDGSEERFADYLRDPSVSHEVRVKALELLIRQWTYSSSMFSGGAVLREMPDPAERDAVIRDVLPVITPGLREERGVASVREALVALRQGTDTAAVQAEIDAALAAYMNEVWTPCLVTSGAGSAEALLNLLSPALVLPRLTSILRDSTPTDLDCFVSNINDVAWFSTNADLAQAYVDRYNAGTLTDHPQARYTFAEYSVEFSGVPAIREFYFTKIAEPTVDPLHLNFMLDALAQNPQPDDRARYVSLLAVPNLIRWTAFDMLIKLGGSEGLEQGLSSLPASGPMNYYDGEMLPNGFKLAAENIACNRPRLSELGDYARQAFERHLDDANQNTRALSLVCLKAHGNAQTVARLTEWIVALGPEPVPTPEGFGGMTYQDLAREVMTAIQNRLAAPPPAAPPATPPAAPAEGSR